MEDLLYEATAHHVLRYLSLMESSDDVREFRQSDGTIVKTGPIESGVLKVVVVPSQMIDTITVDVGFSFSKKEG